jgi:predicted enzyme related to lactoylglutathione lyase
MPLAASFGHTNLIARDWRRLAAFYQHVFGCSPVPPERQLQGGAIARGSAVPGARLEGVHLRLPGHGDTGPTLEIFTYHELADTLPAVANRPGFGHIAFMVPDVAASQAVVLAAGGAVHGDIVTTTAGSRSVTWCYVRDPEGNLVELQCWND